MKIVSFGLYNPFPNTSGVDSYISYLLDPLGKNNDVTHYYFYKSKEKNKDSSSGINFYSKYVSSYLFSNIDRKPRLIRLLRPDLYISKRSLKNIVADVVICDTFTFNVAHYISKRNKCPIIMIKHNIEWKYLKNDKSKLYLFLKLYENYTNKKSDAIITISMNDYRYLLKNYDKDKIFYVPHRVNTNIFNPKGPSYIFEKDKLNLLFYGSLDRPMNIEALEFIKNHLIPSLKRKGLMDKIRINIFGSGNPPKHLNIKNDKNINFLGTVDDPGYFIRGADLIIAPLKNSGGVKIRLLESLYCGKPIIATTPAVDGLSEELKNMIIIKNDARGFTEAIDNFVKDKRKIRLKNNFNFLKKQMIGTTMQYVLKNFF